MNIEIEYYIEVPVKVTCTVSKGYPATHTDPECPDEIEDLEQNYDPKEIEKILKREKGLVEEAIWEEVHTLSQKEQ